VLKADDPRGPLRVFGVASALAAGWLAWFVFGAVPVYEATENARIEVYDSVSWVDAPVAAQVEKNELQVGRHFRAGDVLVELNATLERARVEEERALLAAVEPEVASLNRQLEVRGFALADEAKVLGSAVAEARSNEKAAGLLASSASTEAERAAALQKEGLVPEMERIRRESEAEQRAATSEALLHGAERAAAELRAGGSSGKVTIEALRREIVVLVGRRRALEASVERWQAEVQRRTLRAAIDGTVAEALPLVAGAYVHEGDRLGSLVPAAKLKIVANFPEASIGRVRAGQTAQMRLTGFSWVEFGVISARVLRAASEVRDGNVRVELEPRDDGRSRVPLQHGLPGSVEVLVERASPASLVLRNVGRYLGEPAKTNDGSDR
jgi:membrane fusion protein (multidrug efflux system)